MIPPSNFAHLLSLDDALAKQGALAEQLLLLDPSTCIAKLRQFAELMAKQVAIHSGAWQPDESQHDRLDRLRRETILNEEVARVFQTLRQQGNRATHELAGDPAQALALLRLAWQLSWWFHHLLAPESITADLQPRFVAPTAQIAPGAVHVLRQAEEAAGQTAELQIQQTPEQLIPKPAALKAAQKAAQLVNLSEPETRILIDQALREAGWEVDTHHLKYSAGTRPEKGHNRAIAEWPTAKGPADYVLFIGLRPVAVIEAKRKNKNAYTALTQAERYSQQILHLEASQFAGGPWGEYQVPFLFSTNGRPYLKQVEVLSGIWFQDMRHRENHPRALVNWYTPEGLHRLLTHDPRAAQQTLETTQVAFAFPLRAYQRDAIRAVEAAMARQQRQILVAMATGTGKTKTCIALIYRLLRARRVNRVLFLVDRRSLGEQAAGAFKDTRMEGVQNFADIYNLAELGDANPGPDTVVHVATVQSMVSRVFSPADGQRPLATDTYDCIIVDEAHRGYLLDRDLSVTEMTFRDGDDYLSKYRRVLEYFDATRIGLTATPALHTVQIFGEPVYTYSYQQAVVDGFLVDHQPPTLIKTRLSQDGIHFGAGDDIDVLDVGTGEVSSVRVPDELSFDIDSFNKKVMTESFNEQVCRFLAKTLPITSQEKTLIFCANDLHADLVVKLLRRELDAAWGGVDPAVVAKITGTVDDPLGMIRKFKNEKFPNIAVTVDLLTTGIDVPEIGHLVFLRRVKSRILYDQMLGRATRPCDRIQKDRFTVYDAVGIYAALKHITEMKPVVQQVDLSFRQLIQEIRSTQGTAQQEALRQFQVKLHHRRRRMSGQDQQDFQTVSGGLSPEEFLGLLSRTPAPEIAAWLTQNTGLSEVLDQMKQAHASPVVISGHSDELLGTDTGYGADLVRPADYLESFTAYIRNNPDHLAALDTVLTRPAELTRQDLKALELKLRQKGFTSLNLDQAWKETTNAQGAAQIIAYIRQAALGESVKPFAERVDAARKTLLASAPWTVQEEAWLSLLAAQTKVLGIVDTDTLNDPDLQFRERFGPLKKQDHLLGGQLSALLKTFNEAVWRSDPGLD